MKRPVQEYTDAEIQSRLVFAARLRGMVPERKLAPWLEQEATELEQEQLRRVECFMGEGI